MKIFITGATGFIGRRLTDKLVREGHEVTALTRNDNHRLPPAVKIAKGDMLDAGSLTPFAQKYNRLYHLAAMITFDPAKKVELMHANSLGTSNILNAAVSWGIETIVVASSACTMGITFDKNKVQDETSVPDECLAKGNPYMCSKLETEKEALEFSKKARVIIVNPTTVYGPGDYSLNSGTLIAKIATSSVIPVPPGGGNVVDVDDLVEGIIAAGERGKSGSRYILGGHNLLFRDIFKTVAEVVGKKPLFIPMPGFMRVPMSAAAAILGIITKSRFITPQIVSDLFAYKFCSSSLAEKELGWKAGTPFKDSVARAWEFYKKEKLI